MHDERDEIGDDKVDLERFRRQERVLRSNELDDQAQTPVQGCAEERWRDDEDGDLTDVTILVQWLPVRGESEHPSDDFACEAGRQTKTMHVVSCAEGSDEGRGWAYRGIRATCRP